MKRGAIWIGSVGVIAVLLIGAAFTPDFRLNWELTMAQKEGLITDLAQVHPTMEARYSKANAAPLIRRAIEIRTRKPAQNPDAVEQVLKGSKSPKDRAEVEEFLAWRKDMLDEYHAAAKFPSLDFERDWGKGYELLLPEYAHIKSAVKLFAAAAAIGDHPKQNLVTVAHLSALVRQEPTLVAQMASISIGEIALRQASKQGLGKEVEAELGPPIDVRWAYAVQLPNLLDGVLHIGTAAWLRENNLPEPSLWDRLKNAGPNRSNAAYRIVHAYRQMWREFPDGLPDYDAASRAMDRHMPAILQEVIRVTPQLGPTVMGPMMSASYAPSDPIQSFKRFEENRKQVRAGRPMPPPPNLFPTPSLPLQKLK